MKIINVLCIFIFSGLAFAASKTTENSQSFENGILAVVNKSDNSISIIDADKKQIIKTLPTGTGPHELVLSSDAKWAVSTDFVGGNSLTIFDMQRLEVARTIELTDLPGPHGIQFLADDKHVIFTSGKSQHVGMANVLTGELIEKIETGQDTTHMLTTNADESIAYSTNIRSNSISVLDMNKRELVKNISTQAMPEAIKYRKSARELWYGANNQGKVLVLNPQTEAVLAEWGGFSFPYRVLFNHDESVAIVPDFRNHYVRFFDAKNKTELGMLKLEDEAGPQGITLHPTEDIAFLSLNLKNKVVAIDIDQQKIIAEFPTGNNPDGVVFFKR